MSRPAFSIIVPVYNIAPYLRECLDSVASQSFEDWECICVDDGSTDGSGEILDEYSRHDGRFRIIHQENAGVSAARNAALAAMEGASFLFVDGDDSITPDALASFREVFEKTPVDAILCHPVLHAVPSAGGKAGPESVRVLAVESRPVNLLVGQFGTLGYPFSRIYKTAKFGHLRFAEGVAMCEDNRYWAEALCVPARWAVVDKRYYIYRSNRPGAETSNASSRHHVEHLDGYACVLSTMAGPMDATDREIAGFCRKYRNEMAHVAFEAVVPWNALRPDERRALSDAIVRLRGAASPDPLPFATRLLLPGCRLGLARATLSASKALWRIERHIRHKLNR